MKTLILANTKAQADLIARQHDFKPWQWRYVFGPDSLRGLNGHTILVAQNWVESPIHKTIPQKIGPPIMGYQWPMSEELHTLQMLGLAEIVYVAT